MTTATQFIILIGGPGTFEPCDRAHDQTWKNYIVPIQVAVQKKQFTTEPGETMQWWVYAPAYTERWNDDLKDIGNRKLDRGRELLDSRGQDITNVRNLKASNYLDRIEHMAKSSNATFKALNSVDDFWSALQGLPTGSVSRLWYIGHASSGSLMLKLIHNNGDRECAPRARDEDKITIGDLAKYAGLISGKLAAKPGTSKFYGCNTKAFAEQWNTRFGSAAEGAIAKIDFGLIDNDTNVPPIPEILPRLQGKNWQRFEARPRP